MRSKRWPPVSEALAKADQYSVSGTTSLNSSVRDNLQCIVRQGFGVSADDFFNDERIWVLGTIGLDVEYVNPGRRIYPLSFPTQHERPILVC